MVRRVLTGNEKVGPLAGKDTVLPSPAAVLAGPPRDSVTVDVNPLPEPPPEPDPEPTSDAIAALPSSVAYGASTKLSWSSHVCNRLLLPVGTGLGSWATSGSVESDTSGRELRHSP